MAPQAHRKRPQFFKVLPADLFINQMIPRKFQKYFPHKHRKTATLVSPNSKFWHVKITRIGRDIYFQKEGWLEFAKAHGLEKGYMLIFRYEGNMIFNVKIFDTTCCLKDYSLTNYTMPIWAPSLAPVNASTHDPGRTSVEPANASALGLAGIPVVSANASAPGLAGVYVAPANMTAPGPIEVDCAERAHNSTNDCVCVHTLASSPAASLEPALSLSLVSIPGPALRRSYINIEEMATNQALDVKSEESELGISCNSFATSRKLSGKRQVKIKREIKDIDEESDGEIQVPADTLNKKRKFLNGKSKSITRKENKPASEKMVKKEKTRKICPKSSNYTQFEKILTDAGLKNGLLSIPKSFCITNGLVTTRIIFLTRKVEGKSEILHKKWPVRFFFRPSEGQFRNGWKYFMEENGLKREDKCNFRLVSKDTLLVSTDSYKKYPRRIKEEIVQKREVSSKKKKLKSFQKSNKIMAPKRKWRNRKNRTADKTETWTIVRPYHLAYNYMTLSRGFCIENMLISKRKMKLKDPQGKEWHIMYYLNGSKEGRFRGLEWEIFSMENGLKEGDKCNFKLVAEDTMLFHVDKE